MADSKEASKLVQNSLKQQEAKRKEAALFEKVIADLQQEYYSRHQKGMEALGPNPMSSLSPRDAPYSGTGYARPRNQYTVDSQGENAYGPAYNTESWSNDQQLGSAGFIPGDSPPRTHNTGNQKQLSPQEVLSLLYAHRQLQQQGINIPTDRSSRTSPYLEQMRFVNSSVPPGSDLRQITASPETAYAPAGPQQPDILQSILSLVGAYK
jgi:hypothetical protein